MRLTKEAFWGDKLGDEEAIRNRKFPDAFDEGEEARIPCAARQHDEKPVSHFWNGLVPWWFDQEVLLCLVLSGP